MTMQVSRPQRKDSSGLFSMLGTIGGAALGGPAGAAIGGSVGGMAGQQGGGGVAPIASNDTAITRKIMAHQAQPQMTAREGYLAFTQLPPHMQQEYARPVIETYKRVTGKLPSQDFGGGEIL